MPPQNAASALPMPQTSTQLHQENHTSLPSGAGILSSRNTRTHRERVPIKRLAVGLRVAMHHLDRMI